MNLLDIHDLHVSVDGKPILKGLTLHVKHGETVALMGPNGSGKSTLAYAIMGHPKYTIESGTIHFEGKNILELEPDERSKLGLFLSFQHPHEIPGVSVSNFLRMAVNAHRENAQQLSVSEFRKMLTEKMRMLNMDKSFLERYLNEGFSGGEKKRAEILQLSMLEPKLSVLDETDSGLDIDALRTVAEGVNHVKTKSMAVLIITHYQRILNYITPDRVLILMDGRVAHEGDKELITKLESQGYAWLKEPIDASDTT